MSRGATSAAISNTATGQQDASSLLNAANTAGAPAQSFFQNELNNPQGFSPQQLASMTTASQQSLGGNQAGAVGAGNLLAARTGNAAGLTGALDQSARNNAKQSSQNNLGIQTNQANLQQQQQQSGAQGLESIYGKDLASSLQSLGLSNQAIGQWTNAANETNSALNTGLNVAKLGQSLAGSPGTFAAFGV